MPDDTTTLLTYEGTFARGAYEGRPNRFTVTVSVDGSTGRAYLRNSGGLETTLEAGREVLLRPVDDPDRATEYDALAVRVGDTWVTLDATLPNTVFERCVRRGLLPRFESAEVVSREPPLPGEGRTDFELATPGEGTAYVEVKSNTYVVDGVSKFPDRPTERGRRHLRELATLAREGCECHVVFVVQRPDVDRVRPFRAVDPAFADLLDEAAAAGVEVSAVATRFDPPTVRLSDADVPVDLG